MSVSSWLEAVKPTVSEGELSLLHRAADILVGNIVPGNDLRWSPFRGICPSNSHFHGIWNWDSAFIAEGVARFDPMLAQEQFKAIFKNQLPNGLVPDVVWNDNSRPIEDRFGKPPVWAQAVEAMDKLYPDTEFLKYAYTRLVRNETFWRSERFKPDAGLFVYGTTTQGKERETHLGYESGWDNAVRWDGGLDNLFPIDLNCFMVGFYNSMVYIASRLGFSDDVFTFGKKSAVLAKRINETLWDEESGCYYDYNFTLGKPNYVLTPASFMPLYVGIASKEQAEKMNALARNEKKLYPGMPTVAYDDPGYSDHGYWRGPTWLNVAYFAVKGLYDYGFFDTARGIKDEILSWVYAEDSIHENYDSIKKAPLCSKDFSWSAVFVIEFILNIK